MTAEASPQMFERLARVLECANENAVLAIEALCSQSAVIADGVHQARPNAGQVQVAETIRRLLGQSQLARLPLEQVPRFVVDRYAPHALGAKMDLVARAFWCRGADTHLPDRYSVHCTPQIHGALLDQLRRVAPNSAQEIGDRAVAAWPPADPEDGQALSAVRRQQSSAVTGIAHLKAAIAAMSSISERRLAKMLDPTQNNGLPAALVPNPDGKHYGLMILRYRAAVLVSELSDLATPVRSSLLPVAEATRPPETLADDGPEAIDSMCEALLSVLALERYAAVQALRVRLAMVTRAHCAATAPAPGEFAQHIINQFNRAGLPPVWDGQNRSHEVETVRRMLVVGQPVP
jgi:histidine ammonia-lyase